jgi:hypothetical protein
MNNIAMYIGLDSAFKSIFYLTNFAFANRRNKRIVTMFRILNKNLAVKDTAEINVLGYPSIQKKHIDKRIENSIIISIFLTENDGAVLKSNDLMKV